MDEDKKTYELCYLLNVPETEAEITRLLSQYQCEVLHQSKLSEVRLAYPVKKHQSALLGFSQFSALPENADNIKKSLVANQKVLRSMLINLSSKRVAQIKEVETLKQDQGVDQKFERPVKPIEPKVARPSALTNEALEEKLEEILK